MTRAPSSRISARLWAVVIWTGSLLLGGSLQAQPIVDAAWAKLPEGSHWDGSTTWITPDGRGNVVVLVRKAPYFRVFTREGQPVRSFGDEGLFETAHSLSFDAEGNYWVSDSTAHVVRKISPDGRLLLTLGQPGVAGDNAATDRFNQPNHVAFSPNGDVYVSDGYVNARIVQFTPDGKFVRIIGGVQGSAAGQLQVPHGVALDSTGRILVNDSDNKRVSVFAPDGGFVESWPVPSRGGITVLPDDTVYVSDVNEGIVNVLRDGKLLDSIRVDRAHGLGVDLNGDIYVSGASRMTVYKVTRP
jgi:sugar lactone lactonase YvrE